MTFTITKTNTPIQKPDQSNLTFGKDFTDHMFTMDYSPDKGWHDGQILPFGPLSLAPSALVFHYGQSLFEGLKAYKTSDGRILLFRPDMNAKRSNNSASRMCMPKMDEELYVKAIKELVSLERDHIPTAPGTSLYIRPFMFATDRLLSVHASDTYKFVIILSPVGQYYSKGLSPTKLWVEQNYIRSAHGGTGETKCAGNYGCGLIAQEESATRGFDQILWLDAKEHKYVEEVGSSNVFFVIGDEVITPPLSGTILPGITRDSVLQLLKSQGYKVSERKLTIDEVLSAIEEGKLKEAFGTGTAAVISAVGVLHYNGVDYVINNNEVGEITKNTYDTIRGIQIGELEDRFNWTIEVK